MNRNYVVNGRNQYVQSGPVALGYDGRGNLSGDGTWAFGYDAENQMRSAVSTGWNDAYAYDSDNRLRSAAVNGSQTNYMYDDDDLVAEYDGGFGLLRRFVPGPGVDEPLVWYEGSSLSAKRWFTADNQGSIIAVTDAGGSAIGKYAYGRWGEPGAPITGTSFAYTGQRVLPGTDLYYSKARIYSPWLGRFMQTDPIGTADDLNLYAYVGNDPGNNEDPSGECPACIGAAIGGGIDLGLQLYQNGGNFRKVNWWSVGASAALGAVGNVGFGRLAVAGARSLSVAAKGRVGVAVARAGIWARREQVFYNEAKAVARISAGKIPELGNLTGRAARSFPDFVVKSKSGYRVIEAKFGTSGLTGAQRALQGALGGNGYRVSTFGYGTIRNMGGTLGSFGLPSANLAVRPGK